MKYAVCELPARNMLNGNGLLQPNTSLAKESESCTHKVLEHACRGEGPAAYDCDRDVPFPVAHCVRVLAPGIDPRRKKLSTYVDSPSVEAVDDHGDYRLT